MEGLPESWYKNLCRHLLTIFYHTYGKNFAEISKFYHKAYFQISNNPGDKIQLFFIWIYVLYLPNSCQQEIILYKDQKYIIKMIFYELSTNFVKSSNSWYFTISEKDKQIGSASSVFPIFAVQVNVQLFGIIDGILLLSPCRKLCKQTDTERSWVRVYPRVELLSVLFNLFNFFYRFSHY